MVSEPTSNGATLQRWIRPLLLVMGAVVFFCLVTVTVMAIQLNDIEESIVDVEAFVDELREERESGDGVSTEELRLVFRQISEILQALCGHVPDDPVCLQG